MANQDQQGGQGQQGQQGQGDRDREGNIGKSGNEMHKPAGTSGQQPNRTQQGNKDEEDTGIGNRSTNR
jgi:hypothetical protein